MKKFYLSAAAAWIANGLMASPMSYTPVGNLLAGADSVVVGSIESATQSGSSISVNVLVSRVVEGVLMPGSSVQILFESATPPALPAAGRTSGIFFLKQNGGAWLLTPTVTGGAPFDQSYIPVPFGPLPPSYAYAASASAATKLSFEIAAAAEDGGTGAVIARIAGSGALDDLGQATLQPIWAQLSSSSSDLARAIGLGGQIRAGSAPAIAAVASASPSGFTALAQDHLSAAVCAYRGTDPAGVASLGALATSTYGDGMKFCAAHALRSVHTAAAVPLLASLLDSGSLALQYEAVAGIASFAMGLPVQTNASVSNLGFLTLSGGVQEGASAMASNFPSQRTFLKAPQQYTSFWKNWLATHPAN